MPTIEVKGSGDRARALHQAIPGETQKPWPMERRRRRPNDDGAEIRSGSEWTEVDVDEE
jgi:hypothetical protein